MTDVHSRLARKRNMEAIRHKDTKPEMLIRRGLHSRGLRFLLHDKRLPGKPDLVFPKFRAVMFVHGCFWHRHDCPLFKWPATRKEFWKSKLNQNFERDQEVIIALQSSGWRVLNIWECAVKGTGRLPLESVLNSAESWLRSNSTFAEIRETKSKEPDGGWEAIALH